MALHGQGRPALMAIALVILLALLGWLIRRKAYRAGCCEEAEVETPAAPEAA